jgi:hypothetical protein
MDATTSMRPGNSPREQFHDDRLRYLQRMVPFRR